MSYLYIKALHIIFVVSWFAGLFYLPRLLVYHTEAQNQPAPIKDALNQHFIKTERLLFNAIMVPAMCLTLLTGATMLYLTPEWLSQGWLHLKLSFVLALLHYHFYSRKLVLEMRQGTFRWTSVKLRLWNEWATVILFAIVFLVVLKNSFDWIWGVLGVISFAIIIMSVVKLVNKKRKN